jgi:hypothetical protein
VFEERKKRRQIERQIENVDARIQDAAAHGRADMLGMAVINLRFEKDHLTGSLRQLDTDNWIERAKRHHIKVPADDEYWQTVEIDQATEQRLLTEEGKHYIKNAIHETRFHFVQQWGWLIASITAILSLIFSLIALLKK